MLMLFSETANGGVLQIIISTAAKEAKIRHDAKKLNNFLKSTYEEAILVVIMDFPELLFWQEVEFSCRTHQNSAKKPENK